jgi:arginyl-tRNA synthetase
MDNLILYTRNLFAVFLKQHNIELSNLIFNKPPQAKLGNLSTNIFLLIRKMNIKIDQVEIDQFINELQKDPKILKIDFIQPGFINLYFRNEAIFNHLD